MAPRGCAAPVNSLNHFFSLKVLKYDLLNGLHSFWGAKQAIDTNDEVLFKPWFETLPLHDSFNKSSYLLQESRE